MSTSARRYLLVLLGALAPLAACAFTVNKTDTGAEIKWPVRSVSYLINSSSGPTGASTAIQSAMNTWSIVSGATFKFSYAGSTTLSGSIRDSINVCSFGDLGTDGAVAQNNFWFSGTGKMVESDIVFDTYFSWSVTGAAGMHDLQGVATHELGHSLSLADQYGTGDTEKTMYGRAAAGETKKRSLDSDDINGIVYLYPAISSVTLGLSGSPMAEAGGVATVTATLSAVADLPVAVALVFSGTATLTSDYKRSGTSITIPAGSLSGAITLTAVQDTLDEGNETIVVDITSVINGSENGTQQVTATITDDDPPPTVTLGLSNSPMAEAGGVATVTASLSAVSGLPVTVNLAFSGTATLASDYTRSATSITIPAGSVSRSMTLTAVQDMLEEGNETIVVDISSVVNGNENGRQQVTAVITDDDYPPPPEITMQPASQAVPVGTKVTFSVSASGALPLGYYWRQNGIPIAGANGSSYTLNNVQLTNDGSRFSCLVSNRAGITTSQDALLAVGNCYLFTTLAGQPGANGFADGMGRAARFESPWGVAVDSAGNVFVADTYNHTIRKITTAGVVTTLAGSPGYAGSVDGTGNEAQFCNPRGVAVDSAGNVFVADTDNNMIRKITPGGVVTTLAGSAVSSGSADGTGSEAQFCYPRGVAVDSAGNVFVADTDNNMIRKITPTGVVTTLAGSPGYAGSADGTGSAARFKYPTGLAVDSAGNMFVGDNGNNTIRKITPGGVVTALAGSAQSAGSTDDTGIAARFNSPQGVAVDSTGNVFVADTGNNTIRKVTSAGVVTTIGGLVGQETSCDGEGSLARFNGPFGIAVDAKGWLYITDSVENIIRVGALNGIRLLIQTASGTLAYTNGTFRLRIEGMSQTNALVIESSTDLVNWTPMLTNTTPTTLFKYTDPKASNQVWQFYRAKEIH